MPQRRKSKSAIPTSGHFITPTAIGKATGTGGRYACDFVRVLPTTVRVVCANTLNLALSRASGECFGGLAIPHRPNLDDRVKEARQKLGIVAARFDAFDEELHAMLKEQLSGKRLRGYFEAVLPEPKRNKKPSERAMKRRQQTIDQFRANLDHDTNTLRGIKGTAWAAYNAVSQWADHQRGFRGQGLQRQANRLNSVWFGASHQLKQRAWKEAVGLSRNWLSVGPSRPPGDFFAR